MKKILCAFLAVLLLCALTGCNKEKSELREPVKFYYCLSDPAYGAAPGVIGHEARESAGHAQDFSYLLDVYLAGPESYTLRTPFPTGTALTGFSLDGKSAAVQLSTSFAKLSGISLTLACACITLTVWEISGAEQVSISVEGMMLDGNAQITMNRNSLLLLDDSNIVIDPD